MRWILFILLFTAPLYSQTQLTSTGGKGSVLKSDSLTTFVTPAQLSDSLDLHVELDDSLTGYVTPSQLSDSLTAHETDSTWVTADIDTANIDVLLVTGTITGKSSITTDTDASVVLSAADCKNAIRINGDADAIDYTLPEAETGLVVLFYDLSGGVITIDCDASDVIYLDGTALTAGNAIDSPGSAGDFICLVAVSGSAWATFGRSGTWVDGGAD